MLLIESEDSSICTGKKFSLVNDRQSAIYKLVQNPNLQAEHSTELSVVCNLECIFLQKPSYT